ncbi:MAG: hypothetical protein K1X55_11170 [Chitinophagales bacterium]|nr:hypothetical protein [Chitinophagales bacterium]
MGNYLSDEAYYLHYRHITKRQKRRKVINGRNRSLLRKDDVLQELYVKQKNLGFEDLTSPIFRGYKRIFVLREDVARSHQAEFFEQILKKINTTQYSQTRDFVKRKKKKKIGKVYIAREQQLLQPDAQHFAKLKFNPKERAFFYKKRKRIKGTNFYNIFYVFREPWRFVLKTKKHYQTQQRIFDADLEGQIGELESFFEHIGSHVISHLKGYSQYKSNFWRADEEKYKHVFWDKNLPLYRLINKYLSEGEN